MRLFFAAMLPPEVQRELGKLHRKLDWLPIQGSWVASDNIHITIKFLGEVPDDQVMPLVQAARTQVAPESAIRLVPHRVVMFPPSGSARVLAVGFEGNVGRLMDIQAALENACAALGYERESRAYVPHATLARFKDGVRAQHRPRIEADCASIAKLPPFTLSAIQLMQSKLSQAGSTYTTISTFPL